MVLSGSLVDNWHQRPAITELHLRKFDEVVSERSLGKSAVEHSMTEMVLRVLVILLVVH